jgi:hypothetical protein
VLPLRHILIVARGYGGFNAAVVLSRPDICTSADGDAQSNGGDNHDLER